MKEKFTAVILIALVATLALNKRKKPIEIKCGLASIKTAPVNVFDAPSKLAPISWQLLHHKWPIYITEVKNNWVKIKDAYATIGWIEKKHIGESRALIMEKTYAFEKEETQRDVILLKTSSVKFLGKTNNGWCKIEVKGKIYKTDCRNLWPSNI